MSHDGRSEKAMTTGEKRTEAGLTRRDSLLKLGGLAAAALGAGAVGAELLDGDAKAAGAGPAAVASASSRAS
jgi:hypothetical protein